MSIVAESILQMKINEIKGIRIIMSKRAKQKCKVFLKMRFCIVEIKISADYIAFATLRIDKIPDRRGGALADTKVKLARFLLNNCKQQINCVNMKVCVARK